MDHKLRLSDSARLLRADGRIVNLVSSPDPYQHEWASFSPRDFPDNRRAQSGDTVRIIVTDIEDSRSVESILCTDANHRTGHRGAGLESAATHRPLETDGEPLTWVNEPRIGSFEMEAEGVGARVARRRPGLEQFNRRLVNLVGRGDDGGDRRGDPGLRQSFADLPMVPGSAVNS